MRVRELEKIVKISQDIVEELVMDVNEIHRCEIVVRCCNRSSSAERGIVFRRAGLSRHPAWFSILSTRFSIIAIVIVILSPLFITVTTVTTRYHNTSSTNKRNTKQHWKRAVQHVYVPNLRIVIIYNLLFFRDCPAESVLAARTSRLLPRAIRVVSKRVWTCLAVSACQLREDGSSMTT